MYKCVHSHTHCPLSHLKHPECKGPLSICNLQTPALHAHCRHFLCRATCTLVHTTLLWPLQESTLTCLLCSCLLSGTCTYKVSEHTGLHRHLHPHAHCQPVLCRNMQSQAYNPISSFSTHLHLSLKTMVVTCALLLSVLYMYSHALT